MTDSSITDIKQHVCIWRAQKKSKFINKYNTYTLWSVRILTVPFNVVPQQQLCTWIWLISCENMNILDFRRFKLIKRLPYWCSKAAKIQQTPHNKEVINIFLSDVIWCEVNLLNRTYPHQTIIMTFPVKWMHAGVTVFISNAITI